MARLLTCGFEAGHPNPEGMALQGSAVIAATNARSGVTGLTCAPVSGSAYATGGLVINLGTTYYLRAYVYITAYPSADTILAYMGTSTGRVILTTAGKLQLRYGVGLGTQVGSDSPVLSLNTSYRIEFSQRLQSGADAIEGLIDGVSYASGTPNIGDAATSGCGCGVATAGITATLYVDDFAVNDSTGTVQNAWPGDGKVVMLDAKADSARGTNWLAGAGGTTNLFDAVDNTPPVGLVLASATNTSQVKNAAKDTAGVYDVAVEAYDVAVASGGGGLTAGDTITLVQPVASVGASGAAIVHGIASASNPVIAEGTVTTTVNAAGTFPSNWIALPGTVAYSPAPTLSTRPVLRLRKGTSSTTAAMACFMGLLVEYVPGAPGAATSLPSMLHARRRQYRIGR